MWRPQSRPQCRRPKRQRRSVACARVRVCVWRFFTRVSPTDRMDRRTARAVERAPGQPTPAATMDKRTTAAAGTLQLEQLSAKQVAAVIASTGLSVPVERFEEAEVDGRALADLEDDDMIDALGLVALGSRRRVRQLVRDLISGRRVIGADLTVHWAEEKPAPAVGAPTATATATATAATEAAATAAADGAEATDSDGAAANVLLWDVDAVAAWAAQAGLDAYVPRLREQCITGDVLVYLTRSDLRNALGISELSMLDRGQREIARLRQHVPRLLQDAGPYTDSVSAGLSSSASTDSDGDSPNGAVAAPGSPPPL